MNPLKDFIDKATSDLEKVASEATETAKKVITDAPENIGSAASAAAGAIGSAVRNAPDAIATAASTAADAIGSAASTTVDVVGSVVNGAPEVIGSAASTATTAIGTAAYTAIGTVEDGLNAIYDGTIGAYRKKARIDGFKDGVNQGIYLAGKQRYDFYYAYVATLCYFLRLDSVLSDEEQKWLEDGLQHLKLEGGVPDSVREKLYEIAYNEALSFDDVTKYLDNVSLVSVGSIIDLTQNAIELDGMVSEEELIAQDKLTEYIDSRAEEGFNIDNDERQKAIVESVREYSTNYDKVQLEFREKTKLQDKDIALLMLATMLQVLRVVIINALTEVEAANKNNQKEATLHSVQEKILGNERLFKRESAEEHIPDSKMFASLEHILTYPGVPYDIQRMAPGVSGLFKGGNHRYSTLGHDPLLGLVFGTSNILTNTITITKGLGRSKKGIPFTHLVDYKSFDAPTITLQTGTINMLTHSAKRMKNNPEAAVASFIKQLIHIGTDLYTPCGIQLPITNLFLDTKHVKKLTEYVSMGDILKIGAQASMTVLINWLIAALHGSSLIFKDDGGEFSFETYQARTKKIILISNVIATSSSVVRAAITDNPKYLDLGGAAVLIYRMFTDVRFISKVKEDYMNSKLNDIYEERAKGILY